METWRPEHILIEQGAEGFALTRRVLDSLSHVPATVIRDGGPEVRRWGAVADPLSAGKRALLISRHGGPLLKKCPGTRGFLCCNYYVFHPVTGCPLDCSYCILQAYLRNNPLIRIFADTKELLLQLEAALQASPGRVHRVGTGELADSLALDPITRLSRELVPWFGAQGKALLELKTKTASVENLLDLPHAGRTVVAWSVNPEAVIAEEEKGSASLAERLAAARRCREAGYPVAFHFDPLILGPGWEAAYMAVVQEIFSAVAPEAIAWISLGGLRFTPEVKRMIRLRFPESRVICGELVPCADGKLRYLRVLRIQAYRHLLGAIRRFGPEVPLYLCMETADVWEAVFEDKPRGICRLSGIF